MPRYVGTLRIWNVRTFPFWRCRTSCATPKCTIACANLWILANNCGRWWKRAGGPAFDLLTQSAQRVPHSSRTLRRVGVTKLNSPCTRLGRPSNLVYHGLIDSGTGSRRSYGHLPNLSGDGDHLLLCDGPLQLQRVQWVGPKGRPDLRWMRRQRTLSPLRL